MQNTPSIVSVLWRYKQNEELSQPELKELEQWLKKSPKNQELFDDLSNEARWDREIAALQAKDGNATWNKISRWIEETEGPVHKTRIFWLRYAIAASVIILFASAGYVLLHEGKTTNRVSVTSQPQQYKNDIQPESSTTVLTLADGTVISLDSAHTGMIAKQANTTMIKDSGQLFLKLKRGGDQMLLPDIIRLQLRKEACIRLPFRMAVKYG